MTPRSNAFHTVLYPPINLTQHKYQWLHKVNVLLIILHNKQVIVYDTFDWH